jgi:hypothetical protein
MVKKTKRRNSHQSKRRKTLKKRYKRKRVSHKRKNKRGGMQPAAQAAAQAAAKLQGKGRVEDILHLKPLNEVYPVKTINFLDELYVKERVPLYDSEQKYLDGKINIDTFKKDYKEELLKDEYTEDDIKEMLDNVVNGVTQNIDFYKIEAGKFGFIESHGATIADENRKPIYTKVPPGINLILLSQGGKTKAAGGAVAHYTETINYPGGSLIEDYKLEFKPTYTDTPHHTHIRTVGVFGNEEILSEEHTKLTNLLYTAIHYKLLTEIMLTKKVKEEYIKDDYGIISNTPSMYENTDGYYIYSLSSILRTISDNLATLPKYYLCSFCRGGKCVAYGTDALSECNTDGFLTLPENIFNTDKNESVIDLRRQSSLSGSNALRYFTSIIDELIDYGRINETPWLDKLYRLNEKYTYTYEEVCYILQLRVSLVL